jgi:hypothetical protein
LISMDTKTPATETPEETPEARAKLLNALKPRDRELIESILADNPALTAAIEHCDAFGGLSLSGTGLREMLAKSSEKLEIPAHWKDTTSENSGTKYAIIGTPDQQPKKAREN